MHVPVPYGKLSVNVCLLAMAGEMLTRSPAELREFLADTTSAELRRALTKPPNPDLQLEQDKKVIRKGHRRQK